MDKRACMTVDDVVEQCAESTMVSMTMTQKSLSWRVAMTNLGTWKEMNPTMTSMKATSTPHTTRQLPAAQVPPPLPWIKN